MLKTRRISSTRWWNNKKLWVLFIFFFLIVFVRFSKSLIYRDIYYFISRPFWPSEFQREILLKGFDKELNIRVNQLEKDNLRLRKLLSLQRSAEIDRINSSVISRHTGSWWKKIILNKGLKDGVQIGDAVIGPGGLLGIIEETSFLTSSVKLLTSTESKVGVWIQRTDTHGLLTGIGTNSPRLTFFSKDIDVEVGDFIFSSPASTILPPNIAIGIIEFIDKTSQPITIANVQLIANPQAIDWVQILKLKI
tara:strand:+ start:1332 stop:2081 length:750 start_codon:yes stop_codon:yes gene_type:complete